MPDVTQELERVLLRVTAEVNEQPFGTTVQYALMRAAEDVMSAIGAATVDVDLVGRVDALVDDAIRARTVRGERRGR